MAQYVINTGSLPNDGTGTPLRTAFTDTNLNFNQIFAAGPVGSNIQITNNTITTTNVNGNLILATNGTGVIVAAASIQPDQANLRMVGSYNNRFNTVYTQYLDTQSATISGNLAVNGNLYVQGNTVTANTSVLNVANATITVSAGAPYPALADGSGLLVGGANAAFLYAANGNLWQSNLPIQAPAFIGDGSQLTNVAANVSASAMSGNTINGNVLYSSLVQVGALNSLTVVGNLSVGQNILSNTITTGEISAIAFFGNGAGLNNIVGSNVVGNVANATYATFAGTAGSANLAATATQALNAQNAINALNAQTANTAQFADIANWANCADLATTAYQANSAVVAGRAETIDTQATITVTGNIVAGGILTNNYYFANGTPATFGGSDYSNANVASYLPVYSGDLNNLGNIAVYGTTNLTNTVISGSTSATTISAQGNIQGAAVYANGFFYGNGTPFTGAGFVLGDQQFYGNGSVGPYTMTQTSTSDAVIVTINGLTQTPDTTYTVTGNLITFTDGINVNELVDIRFLGTGAGGTTDTGNIGFVGDTIYDIRGMLINNSDLTHGYTSGITIPTNGNISPAQFVNTYGNIIITAGNGTGTNSSWTFDGDGNLTLPTNTSSINYANGQPYGGSGGGANLLAVATDIVPSGNNAQSLGNSTNQWNDLYLSNATIYFNSVPLSVGPGNTLTIGGANVVTTSGAGNTLSVTSISVSGNVDAGNILTSGVVSAAGNVRGSNINTVGVVSAAGNISGNYLLGNGSQITSLPAPTVAQDITSTGAMSIMTYDGNLKYASYATIQPSSGNITAGNISATGNIAGNYFIGNGSQLTGITATANTGNIGFVGDAIYDSNGIYLENANLTAAATAALLLPANGNTDNIQLNNTEGNIVLQAGTGDALTAAWLFNSAGNLNLPGNTVFNSTGITQVLNEHFTTRASDDETDGWSIYNIVDDGAGNDLTQTRLEYNQYSVRTNIQGASPYTWVFRESGDLELPNNLIGNVGNSLTIKIGDQSGSDTFIDLQTRSYVGDALISNIRIANPNITISTASGANTWTFDNTGNVTFPDSTVYSGNTFTSPESTGILNNFKWDFSDATSGTDTVTLQWNLLDTTLDQWYLTTGAQTKTWTLDSSTQQLSFGNVGDPVVSALTFGTAANSGVGNVNAIELTSTNSNVYLRANNNSWTFGANGVTTFASGNLTIGRGYGDVIRSTDSLDITGLNLTLTGQQDSANLSQINLDGFGNLQLRSIANNATDLRWNFNADGTTVFPANTVVSPVTGNLTLQTPSGIPDSLANWQGGGGWNQGFYADLVTTGGTGTGLTVDVAAGGGGYISINEITINTPGSGYTNGDVITIDNENNIPGTFTITVAPANWTFDTTGNLTIPNSMFAQNVSSPAPVISGFELIGSLRGNVSTTGNIYTGNLSAVGNTTGANILATGASIPTPVGALVFSGSNWLSFTPGVTIGSGAYTVEAFVYFQASNLPGVVLASLTESNSGFSLVINSATQINIDQDGVATNSYTVASMADNTWHHIAVTRNSSGEETVFVDGVRATTGVTTTNYNFSGASTGIGKFNTGGQWWLNGSASQIRAVVGTNVYDPNASTITVPTTSLTDVSGTVLLLDVDNAGSAITDSSGTQTTTNNGAVTFTSSGPAVTYSVTTGGTISALGNIAGSYFIGNGSQLTGVTASANTGSITFDDITIQGVNGLQLSAGPDFTANAAYLQVRAGDQPSHIHLDTGDNSTYDLLVGDDSKYVQVGLAGNISIASYDNTGPGQYIWNFDTAGNLVLPTINLGVGVDEQTTIQSQRKLIPPFRWSAEITADTPTVVYTATDVNTTSMKVTIQVQHQGLGFELFEVFATFTGSTDTYYVVNNRVAPPTIDPTTVEVSLTGSNVMQITLTVNSGANFSWVTYDAVEFGIPND